MTDLSIILKRPERLALLAIHEIIPIEEEEADNWRQAIQAFRRKKRPRDHPDNSKVFSVRTGGDKVTRVIRIQ